MGFSPLPNSRMQAPSTGQAAPSMPTQGSSRMGMFGGGWGGMFNPRSLFGQMPSPQVGVQQGAMPRSLAWYLPLLMSRGMFGRPFSGNMPTQAQGTPQAPNVAQPATPITAPQAPLLPYAPPPTFQAPTQQQAQPIMQPTPATTPTGVDPRYGQPGGEPALTKTNLLNNLSLFNTGQTPTGKTPYDVTGYYQYTGGGWVDPSGNPVPANAVSIAYK